MSIGKKLLMGYTYLFLAILYVPFVIMGVLSFAGPRGGAAFTTMNGFSLRWYKSLFIPNYTDAFSDVGEYQGHFWQAMALSLLLALVVTAISTTMAVLAAMGFRRHFRGQNALFYLFLSGMILPGIAIGLGVSNLSGVLDIPLRWYTTVVPVHVIWTFPFAFIVMLTMFNRFDAQLEEAAANLGAPPKVVFREITLPLIKPGILSSAMFCFTLSWDELVRTLWVSGESNTLPLELWGSFTQRVTPKIYALGTVTTFVSFAVITVFVVMFARELRRQIGGVKLSH